MTGSIRGRLLSPVFARTILPTLAGAIEPPGEADRALEHLGRLVDTSFGPATGPRTVTDAMVIPLLRALQLRVTSRADAPDEVRLDVGGSGPGVARVVVRGWSEDLDRVWRALVRDGIAMDARWCLAFNGRVARVIDTQRTWTRHFLELDLAALAHDPELRRVLWSIGNGDSLTSMPALLDAATRLSDEHGTGVSRALGAGVVKGLASLFVVLRSGRSQAAHSEALLEQCLTVLYRILFLLFAESRGLVPVWHPVYRDQYTIGTMVASLLEGQSPKGIWRAVQAISRVAHAGCSAGALSVNAFNGRLFSPDHTAGIDHRHIDDAVMGSVVLGLGTNDGGEGGRVRTRFDELDVEHLGSVYEQVLEYQPDDREQASLLRTREARKASGTFYTPREIAASLVAHTLEPLIVGRTADQILRLRVLDPAMGSGAFLVAACRFLARRVEEALVAEGRWHASDITEDDRVQLRREVAQRCLYGVDLNPVAAQLARLSLWLVALAHEKPLSFLDHHLLVGDSLVGAWPADLDRPTGAGRGTRKQSSVLPLFEDMQLDATLTTAGDIREALALEPDDTVQRVRTKERRLAALMETGSDLASVKRALDLWCASWFWDGDGPPTRAVVADVAAGLLTGRSSLPAQTSAALLAHSDRLASKERFLHWPLAFPEVFRESNGGAGFDAIIGNPPWDMVRGDSGEHAARQSRREAAQSLTRFVREAGIYQCGLSSHLNRYALFVERASQLVRRSGRVGLVLPSGVLSDAGAAALRTRMLSTWAVDRVTGLENTTGIFPIHRSMKFILLTATSGSPTESIACRFGITRLDRLEDDEPRASLVITRGLLNRLSGADDLSLPHVSSARDLEILESITASAPALADSAGWGARFGRELNASDDRDLMRPLSSSSTGRPIVEGKMLTPFRVSLGACRQEVPAEAVRRTIPERARLAYREVASATNRLTLIAAIVPARAVTTHTVFCLKTALTIDAQHVLCALLNSLVANYLARMRVSTHVTAAIMARLRVPVVTAEGASFDELLNLASLLAKVEGNVEDHPAYASLQGMVAHAYGLTHDQFSHVLGTFPLIPRDTRDRCLDAFRRRT